MKSFLRLSEYKAEWKATGSRVSADAEKRHVWPVQRLRFSGSVP
jgi:hypothetical protein